MRTLIDGLEDAFRTVGAMPQQLLFDQLKAVITRDLRLEGGALVRNAEFLRFAGTGASRRRPGGRTARRPKVRSSGPCAISVAISSTAGRLSATPISIISVSTGSTPSPIRAGTARRRRARASVSVRRSASCCSRWPPAATPRGSWIRRPRGQRPPGAPPRDHGREAGAPRLRGARRRAGMRAASPSRRDRLRHMLADLRMPGALEALDAILQGVDGGT